MVLRTTEYRLQFNSLANDLRKQIWQENFTVRELLRSTNQADHYWANQLIDEECEEDYTTDKDPVSIHDRLNHRNIATKYENRKENYISDRLLSLKDRVTSEARPLQLDSQSVTGREVAAQTPNWEEEFPPQQYDSSQELQHLASNRSVTSIYGDEHVEKCAELPIRPLTPIPPHSPVVPLTVAELIHNQQPSSHFATHSGKFSDGSKSSLHMLTRTSRNNYFENKPPPFESFGWNDLHKDVGKMRTYNVHAPRKEVNKHTLEVYNQRREDIERYLSEEAEKQRKALKSNSLNLSNHSSIWMTEYAENFSPKRKNKVLFNETLVRPKTAPTVHRPLWWRCAE